MRSCLAGARVDTCTQSLRGGGMFKWLVRFAIAKKVYDVVQERRRKRR